MLLSLLLSSLLVFGNGVDGLTTSTVSAASPVPTCGTPSYPSFKLYAQRANGTQYPVRLVADGTTANVTTMAINTNAKCTDCGTLPTYWTLQNKILSPYSVSAASGFTTVNQAVPAHTSPSFVTAKKPTTYPIYCGANSGPYNGHNVLSVNGDSDQFTMCAWTSIVPYPTKFDIVYKRSNIQPVGVSCFPVTLVMFGLVAPIDPPPITIN